MRLAYTVSSFEIAILRFLGRALSKFLRISHELSRETQETTYF
jgi:hypothetical protein